MILLAISFIGIKMVVRQRCECAVESEAFANEVEFEPSYTSLSHDKTLF